MLISQKQFEEKYPELMGAVEDTLTYPEVMELRDMYPHLNSLDSCKFEYWLNN